MSLSCSHCQREFGKIRAASRGSSGVVMPGSMLICPRCGLVSIAELTIPVGFSVQKMTTRPMTESEWTELDPATRDDVRFALRTMLDHARREGFDQLIEAASRQPFLNLPSGSDSIPDA